MVSQDTIEQNYNKYIQSSNPVRAFVEVALEKDSSSLESKDEIYKAFKMFCSSKSLPIESEQSFSRRLKKQYGFNDVQKRDNKGSKCYYWMRLKYI
jgi:Poxvirus D5 protein-like